MKPIILILCAALALLSAGCANSPGGAGLTPADLKALGQATVQLGVYKVIKNNPAKASLAIAVAHTVRELAGGEGIDTVDVLLQLARVKLNLGSRPPEDQIFANMLLDLVGAHLTAGLANGHLTSARLAAAGEVAGWIEDAAKLAAPPAA